jgi:hypothetical protein
MASSLDFLPAGTASGVIASGLNRSFALYRRRNKIRTIACIVNRSPPSHRIVSDSMSTSAKNPHENDSSECITDAVAAVAAASPSPALDPAVGPSPAAAGLVIFRPLRVRVIESDPTRCPDTSARSNGAMCPRATASAADARSHGSPPACASDLATDTKRRTSGWS